MTKLSRPEALEVADKLVERWTGQAKNERGYVHDKWQPVDVTVRTAAVLQVADWLLAGQETAPEGHGTNLVAPAGPEVHQHRASCHGPAGELMCGYHPHKIKCYNAAGQVSCGFQGMPGIPG